MSEDTPQKSKKMVYETASKKKMGIYASPRFGIALFMGLIDFALFFIYTEVYQLNNKRVGLGLMYGKFAIAIAQFGLGWLSDHTHTRWGRRKPYIVVLTPILAVSFTLLILPGLFLGSSPDADLLFTWLVGFNVLAQASYAVVTVYQSWMAEQFPIEQRPTVSTYQNAGNFLGTAIVVLFSMIILTDVKDLMEADPSVIPSKLTISIIIFAVVVISLMYFMVIKMPVENTPPYETRFIDDLKIILANKNMLLVCLMQGICSFAWAMSQSVILTFTEDVLQIQGTENIIVSALMVLIMIGTLFFWKKKIETIGKKKSLLIIFGFAIVTLPLSVLGLFSFATNLIFGIVFVSLVAASLAGWYLFPYIIYADISEDDEKRTGELKAGIYTGFPAIILNAFQAVSLYFTGWITDLPDVSNTPGNTFSLGYIIWGPICAVILVLSLFYAKKYIHLDFKWEKQKSE